jgi:hypothetical protein
VARNGDNSVLFSDCIVERFLQPGVDRRVATGLDQSGNIQLWPSTSLSGHFLELAQGFGLAMLDEERVIKAR